MFVNAMAGIALQVDLYVYPAVVQLHSKTKNQIKSEGKNILSNIGTSTIFRSFHVVPSLLEHYNIRYSEKQVKRIDENFYDYSLGTKFSINVPIQNPPGQLRYLIEKYFSGDVSGDIGEALFAYFLIVEMNVNPYLIGHTRPMKRRNLLTPDFVVWDFSHKLTTLLQSGKYQLPILGEVKAFTGGMDSTRITHGLAQLQMPIANSSLKGILFLVARNQVRQGYDVYTVRVKA